MAQIPSDTSALKDPNTKVSVSRKKNSRKPLTEVAAEVYKPRATSSELTYEMQLQIVHSIALYETDAHIKDRFLADHNIELTLNQINHYRHYSAWKPTIEKVREEFESRISDEELSSKRRRIQELARAYRRLEPSIETLMDGVKIISQIREEVEGKSSTGTQINQYNQYNGISDDDLRKIISENNRFLEVAEKRKNELTLESEAVIGEGNEG